MFFFSAKLYEPASVALFSSRGYETLTHKIFMRATVIAADYVLLLPAIWLTVTALYHSPRHRLVTFIATAAQPGLLLIDHGHFQYNNISLGLTLMAAGLLLRDYDLLAAIFFTLSLNYKQMALYFAPAFFVALLCKSLQKGRGFTLSSLLHVLRVGAVVIATFVVCWAPFLLQEKPVDQVAQLLHRIFPVGRGLYEDKVANLWCSISPVFKLQNFASPSLMVLICTLMTVIGFLPALIYLIHSYYTHPRTETAAGNLASSTDQVSGVSGSHRPPSSFIISMSLVAWSFFFFSFHVHEKTVLLPILPMTLWLYYSPNFVAIANLVSTISMLPLLQRDGHEVSLLIACVVYAIVLKYLLGDRVSITAMFAALTVPLSFHVASYIVKAPAAYPDIWVLLLTSVSFLIMAVCVLGIYIRLYIPMRRANASATPHSKKHD